MANFSNDKPFSTPLLIAALQIAFISALLSFYHVEVAIDFPFIWLKTYLNKVGGSLFHISTGKGMRGLCGVRAQKWYDDIETVTFFAMRIFARSMEGDGLKIRRPSN